MSEKKREVPCVIFLIDYRAVHDKFMLEFLFQPSETGMEDKWSKTT